jgi:hypothetical protein
MYHYVNHHAIRDVFAPVAAETDPQIRSQMMLSIQDQFADLLIEQVERTCWELKHKRQWNTGQIADTLNISERKVKMFIRWYSERTGEWNPLDRPKPAEVIDISHLVRKRENQPTHQRSTEPTHSAGEQADPVSLPTA